MLDEPLLEAVLSRQLDVALLRTARASDNELSCEHVLSDRMCVVLPRMHRLAGRADVSYGDLWEEDFVVCSCAKPRAEARGFDRVVESCLSAGFTPRVVQESSLPYTTLGLVQAGVGVTVLSELFRMLCPDELVFVPLRGESGVIHVVWQSAEPSVIRENFVTVVREIGERLEGDEVESATVDLRRSGLALA